MPTSPGFYTQIFEFAVDFMLQFFNAFGSCTVQQFLIQIGIMTISIAQSSTLVTNIGLEITNYYTGERTINGDNSSPYKSTVKELELAFTSATANVTTIGIKSGNVVKGILDYSIPVFAVNTFDVDESATTSTT